MKLEDILSITSEATVVNVADYELDKIIGCYNGKDSIDLELNGKEVVTQFIDDDELYIVILNK